MKITNRYGTFSLDKAGSLVIHSDISWLAEMERCCGTAFVWEQLRQVQSDLRQQQIRDTRKNK